MTATSEPSKAVPPTGAQFRISHGAQEAVITEVGAGLREYTVDGVPVLFGYDQMQECQAGRGQHLLPWPNRIGDGRYTFAGRTEQLALSEPERGNAIHGLTRWTPWRLVERTDASVTHELRLFPQTGWPATLDLTLTHALDEGGLAVTVTAANVGAAAAPFGYACHPYLTVGEQRVDEVELSVPADRYLEVDERLLPVAIKPVEGTDYDCRGGEPLAGRAFDTAFTDLAPEEDGRSWVRLRRGDRETALWADRGCRWVQVFTGDSLPEQARRASGIAVEPMTCGPDAFNDGPTHDGMLVLQPAESVSVRWGIVAKV
jgi:aldose 1-epimerase